MIGLVFGKEKIQTIQEHKGIRSRTKLMIDNEKVPLERMAKSQQVVWNDPLHRSISMHLSSVSDSHGGTSGCQPEIDGETTHLVEAPRTTWGHSIPEELPMPKNMTNVEGKTTTDPRFAADLLYLAIQSEAKNDEQTSAPLLEALHNEIIQHILIAERLMLSKADYVGLGNDGGDDVHLAVVHVVFHQGRKHRRMYKMFCTK